MRGRNRDAVLPKVVVPAVQHTGSLGEGVCILATGLRIGYVKKLVLLFITNTKRRNSLKTNLVVQLANQRNSNFVIIHVCKGTAYCLHDMFVITSRLICLLVSNKGKGADRSVLRQKFIDLNIAHVLGNVSDKQLLKVFLVSLSAKLLWLERGPSIRIYHFIYKSRSRYEAYPVPSQNTWDTGSPGNS